MPGQSVCRDRQAQRPRWPTLGTSSQQCLVCTEAGSERMNEDAQPRPSSLSGTWPPPSVLRPGIKAVATVGLGQVPQEPQPHRSSQEDHGSPLAPGCPQTLQGERRTRRGPAGQHPRQSPQDRTASSHRLGLSLARPPGDVVSPVGPGGSAGSTGGGEVNFPQGPGL